MQADKPQRTYRRESEWRALVSEFEASGLPAKDFCAKHKIATSGLYAWKKKFESASDEGDCAFIELTTPTNEASEESGRWDVELELGSGIVLRVRTPLIC